VTTNLQLTPEEVKDAYVVALAKKAKTAQPRPATIKKSCGSIGYSESVGDDGEIVKSWVFASHYGGQFVRVKGWATAEDAERALLAHVRSIQAQPRWTHAVAAPPPPPPKKRIRPTFDHVKHGRCPTCGSDTVSSMYGMYEECGARRCGWWNSPPVGCTTTVYNSEVGPRTHVSCGGHDYRSAICCDAWAAGLWSACIMEPLTDPGSGFSGGATNAWRGGFDRAAELLCREVDRAHDRPETFRDISDDVHRLNAHLVQMRRNERRN